LFGHEKGSFTGAVAQKKGKLEVAEGGTVFLDEIGELAVPMQAKLLRVLQEREFERVGGTRPIKLDVRLVAATNRDLKEASRTGAFRSDLYYRLNVVSLHMPALRERKSDVPTLVQHFLDKVAPERMITVSPAAMKCMLQYDWPGNVRELENVIERAVALGSQDTLDIQDLPPALNAGQVSQPAAEQTAVPLKPPVSSSDLEELERATIQRVFEQVNGDKAMAGRMLGISRATLYRKLKRYNIALRESAAAS